MNKRKKKLCQAIKVLQDQCRPAHDCKYCSNYKFHLCQNVHMNEFEHKFRHENVHMYYQEAMVILFEAKRTCDTFDQCTYCPYAKKNGTCVMTPALYNIWLGRR